MDSFSEAGSEQSSISRRTLQEVVLRDSVNLVDCPDDELPSTPTQEGGTGKMTFDFSSGKLETTITTTD